MLTPRSEMKVMTKVKSDMINTDMCLIKVAALLSERRVIVTNASVKPRKINN